MLDTVRSIKTKIIVILIPILVLMIITGMVTIHQITKHSLDIILSSSLDHLGVIAAGSVKAGLEFNDEESITDAVKPYLEDPVIGYFAVLDIHNNILYEYRKEGLPPVKGNESQVLKNLPDEIFISKPVASSGQKIGSVIISFTLNERDQALALSFKILLGLTVAGVGLLVALILFLSNKIVGPIDYLSGVAQEISEGDLEQKIEIHGLDEIGQLAESFRALLSYIHDIAAAADNISNGNLTQKIKVRSDQDVLSDSFRNLTEKLRDIFGLLTRYATDLSQDSQALEAASTELSEASSTLNGKSKLVAQASEQMHLSIETISQNANEMSSTVEEIAQNAEKARVVTTEAVENTKGISRLMAELQTASQEISKVVEVIFEIADQTKLLALNATIEAARAGEAGKGFAVVANEVKELASQTNQATDEIRTKINAMQHSTQDVVNRVESINNITANVNEIVVNIATAVEEQNVTTKDIALNINNTVRASQSISSDLSTFSSSSENVNSAGDKVKESANKLQNVSRSLKEIVDGFRI